jgi:chromosome segregation ATPase
VNVVPQVFGCFVVCKDRATMEAVAASGAPVDAITLDGDVVRRKGTLSGGYMNNARSKFNTYKQVGVQRRLAVVQVTVAFGCVRPI